MFYVWIQEELPSKFHSVNQQDTETLKDLVDVGKMTSETEQAFVIYHEFGDDEDNDVSGNCAEK
jgi:hypothetical protein